MKITLERLSIKNFKGIEKFDLELSGKSATISGTNGLGKSTVADAWYWLISGKDTDLQAGFDILMLDAENNIIDHLDAEVEADLTIDDKKLRLKKIHKQKWTKKRGRVEAEFTGNTTDHFINDVFATQREYQDKLADIIDDTLFRVLSDVRYFCAHAKPEFRRNVLLEMCGEILPEDIIAANPDLAEIDSILSEREINDHKKILAAKRRKINERIDRIPDLIAELRNSISDVSNYDADELRKKESEIEGLIRENISKIGDLVSGIEINELRKELTQLTNEQFDLERNLKFENKDYIDNLLADKTNMSEKLANIMRVNEIDNDRLNGYYNDMLKNEATRSDLMKMWQSANDEMLIDAEYCFNCGQELPENMIDEQKDKFNLHKAEKLRQLNDQGNKLFEAHKSLQSLHEKMTNMIDRRSTEIEMLQKSISEIDAKIHDSNNELMSKYGQKQVDVSAKIDAVKDKIAALEQDIVPEKDRLKTIISKLEDDKDVVKSKLLEITHSEKTNKRIAELVAEQKDLAKEYENSEYELWLIEEYGRRKAEFIEANVAENFKVTKWKLFEIQLNKGIRDVCEPLVGGVPYSTNLNNGARILCGMDCINVISRFYDISCPVFIDNSESLKKWIEFPHQHIRLEATLDDELKVIMEDKCI